GVFGLERAIVGNANLRRRDEIAPARTGRVEIEQDEAEGESGGRWRRSGYRQRRGRDRGDLPAGQRFPRVHVLDGRLFAAEVHAADVASFHQQRTRRLRPALLESVDQLVSVAVAGVALDDEREGNAGAAVGTSSGGGEGVGLGTRQGGTAREREEADS